MGRAAPAPSAPAEGSAGQAGSRGQEVPVTRRIAVINEKGGSGKTTLVANLAAFLARERRHRVLALDMDPQGHLGKVFGAEVRRARRSAVDLLLDTVLGDGTLDRTCRAPERPIVPTRIEGLDLVVANKALALFPTWDDSPEDVTERLASRLTRDRAFAGYDYILMDAPPSFGPLTLNVLRAAHEVVVPVPLTYLGLDGCAEMQRTLDTVRTRYGNPLLRLTLVVPTFYRRTRMAQEVLDCLKGRFPKEIAHTVVGFHVALDEAQSRGLSIFEHAPTSRAARAMAALGEELELRGAPGGAPPEARP